MLDRIRDLDDNEQFPLHREPERWHPAEPVRFGNHVWIANHATLRKGSTVDENAIISAHAVVTGILPPHCVAVGNSARIVREGGHLAVGLDLTAGLGTTGQGAHGRSLIFTGRACSDRARIAGQTLAWPNEPPSMQLLQRHAHPIDRPRDRRRRSPHAGSSAPSGDVRAVR